MTPDGSRNDALLGQPDVDAHILFPLQTEAGDIGPLVALRFGHFLLPLDPLLAPRLVHNAPDYRPWYHPRMEKAKES